jgi:hypothetical protein
MSEPTSRSARLATLGWRAAVIALLLWNLLETRAVREAAEGAMDAATAAQQAVGVLREDLDEALSGDGPVDDPAESPHPAVPGTSMHPEGSGAAGQPV